MKKSKPPKPKIHPGEDAPDDFIWSCDVCNCRLDAHVCWHEGRYTWIERNGKFVPRGLCHLHSGRPKTYL